MILTYSYTIFPSLLAFIQLAGMNHSNLPCTVCWTLRVFLAAPIYGLLYVGCFLLTGVDFMPFRVWSAWALETCTKDQQCSSPWEGLNQETTDTASSSLLVVWLFAPPCLPVTTFSWCLGSGRFFSTCRQNCLYTTGRKQSVFEA